MAESVVGKQFLSPEGRDPCSFNYRGFAPHITGYFGNGDRPAGEFHCSWKDPEANVSGSNLCFGY